MTGVPLALAAGMVAAANPCGFALLPAYLSLLVVGDDAPSRSAAVARALVLTAAMTAGFAGLFGVFGLVVAPVAGSLQRHLPWFGVTVGLLLVGVGGWLLAGRQLPALGLRLRRGPAVTRSVPSMVLFGAAYALTSLGCTIGPFLAVVVSTVRAGSVLDGAGLFLAYAAGMGLMVGTAGLAVALARTSLLGRLRRAAPAVSRAGGVVLILAGGFVAYHGWYEVRLLRGTAGRDPIVDTGGAVQRWAASLLDHTGVPVMSVVFALLLLVGLLGAMSTRTRLSPDQEGSAAAPR
jgi:cytochrome c biogenesis protein CcdA